MTPVDTATIILPVTGVSRPRLSHFLASGTAGVARVVDCPETLACSRPVAARGFVSFEVDRCLETLIARVD
jgi:hypothetical protein